MKRIFVLGLLICVICIFNFTSVYADANNDFWGQANDWFNKYYEDDNNLKENENVKEILDIFKNMINVLGTTVITIVTIFLGIKYMYGSVETKASVKESLVTLLVACVFFFGWTAISELLFPGNRFIFIKETDATFESALGRVFSIATYVANFLAVGAVIYVGVKYILAGANGKAELKAKSGQFIIGIILTFCTVSFLTYVSNIINEVFAK